MLKRSILKSIELVTELNKGRLISTLFIMFKKQGG